MGNPLFGVDISGLINANIGPGVLAATLRKVTPGTPTPGEYTSGTNPTTTDHACRGFIDKQARRDKTGTLIADGTRVIVLIGDSINGGATAPALGDRIVIEGQEFVIHIIDRDPAAATYTCVVRAF